MHTPSQMEDPNCSSRGVRHLGWRTLSNINLIPLQDKNSGILGFFFKEWHFEKFFSRLWHLGQSLRPWTCGGRLTKDKGEMNVNWIKSYRRKGLINKQSCMIIQNQPKVSLLGNIRENCVGAKCTVLCLIVRQSKRKSCVCVRMY